MSGGVDERRITMAKLEIIEGIGPIYAEKLRAADVRSVEALLRAGATPEGRKELEEKAGIGHEYILDWVNRADVMRVRGVGEEYSDLLEKAGVDTVVELAQRNPDHLYQKIIQVNEEKELVRRPPTRNMVARWVEQAKTMDRAVFY
jgi:predicted flap endonuclease-1-like 5' DNA nuclease